MKRIFGGKTIKDGSAIIKLDIPLIAENGAVVPVCVSVDSPMTPVELRQAHLRRGRQEPHSRRHAGDAGAGGGQGLMGANIRLGETGDVRAIVEQSDGTLLQVKREVKVTVGGCGG